MEGALFLFLFLLSRAMLLCFVGRWNTLLLRVVVGGGVGDERDRSGICGACSLSRYSKRRRLRR